MVRERLALCLTLWCVLAGSAHAQATPGWMRVQGRLQVPSLALALSTASVPEASRVRQNRARRILAAGAGFVLSAAIAPAYVLPNRQPCWGSDDRKGGGPLKAAGGVFSVGFVAVTGGATWLALESRRHGYASSRRERVIATGIGALTFALGQALLGAVFFADQICSS